MINRAQIRGCKLDEDCKLAHTTTHESGPDDDRVFCYGICDIEPDFLAEKCKDCKAYVYNAEPIEQPTTAQ